MKTVSLQQRQWRRRRRRQQPCIELCTRVGTLIVATIYLQLIQN